MFDFSSIGVQPHVCRLLSEAIRDPTKVSLPPQLYSALSLLAAQHAHTPPGAQLADVLRKIEVINALDMTMCVYMYVYMHSYVGACVSKFFGIYIFVLIIFLV